MCGYGRDEDYAAAVDGRVYGNGVRRGLNAVDHASRAGLCDEKGAVEVDGESATQVFFAGGDKGLVRYDAGGVDVDVDLTEVL